MAIGTTNKFSFFIVRSEDDPPSSSSDFTEYTTQLVNWRIYKELGELWQFTATLYGTVDSSDILVNTALYVLSGTTLLGKFILDKPEYKGNNQVKITGVQSSGDKAANRDMFTEIKDIGDYEDSTFSQIVNDLVGDVFSTITIDSGNFRVDFEIDYEIKYEALKRVCNLGEKEWIIDHGENDSAPFSEGDDLVIDDRVGSSSSQYTFYLSGANTNAFGESGNIETDTLINDVIIKGSDQNGAQVQTRVYEATSTKTKLNGSLDGWLYDDVGSGTSVMQFTDVTNGPLNIGDQIYGQTSGATAILVESMGSNKWSVSDISGTFQTETIEVKRFLSTNTTASFNSSTGWIEEDSSGSCNVIRIKKGNGFSGSDFSVKIDSELIFIDRISTTNSDYDRLYVWGPQNSNSFGRGFDNTGTNDSPHLAGADVVNMGDKVTGILSIPVDSTTGFPTSLTRKIRIGSEIIEYGNQNSTNFITATRSFKDSYAHGDNVNVYLYYENGTAYTPDNHDTGTTNSIRSYGIKSRVLNEYGGRTKNSLDLKAQGVIENKGSVTRITIESLDYFNALDNADLGDTVTISDVSRLNISNGTYRVMAIEIMIDLGKPTVKYYLNSNSTRLYAMSDYSYVKEKNEKQQPFYSFFSRFLDNKRFSGTTNDASGGCSTPTGGFEQFFNLGGPAIFRNVADPTQLNDAVNLKCLKNEIGIIANCSGIVGSSTWIPVSGCSGYITPLLGESLLMVGSIEMCNNIVAGNTTSCIGSSSSPGSFKEGHFICINPLCIVNSSNINWWINGVNTASFGQTCTCFGPTRINGNLNPNTDNTFCLGQSTCIWKVVYADCFCGSSTSGTSLWEGGFGFIRPKTSTINVVKNTSGCLGTSTCGWDVIYGATFSGTISCMICFLGTNMSLSGIGTGETICGSCYVCAPCRLKLPVGSDCFG